MTIANYQNHHSFTSHEYSEDELTVSVAWFTFDPLLTGPGLQYSEDSLRVSGEGWEHRVALGSVGFSRGVHYWEISIDKFDADTDPAFGIARIDVARDKMLGKLILQCCQYYAGNSNILMFCMYMLR